MKPFILTDTIYKPKIGIGFFLSLLGIVGASFICYWTATDLFFIADDFLWLERAQFTIIKAPLSIFKSEGLYFDPMVYFLFWLNYNFSGLAPEWYHRIDLMIHTINALLLSYLALLLTQNKLAAFFSGLVFAISPTNADAVLWPSSRVDTLATIFYLGSIITYILYHDRKRTLFYYLSIGFFVLSLSAKITPIILPLIILILEAFSNKSSYKMMSLRLIPFFAISGIYLVLLFYTTPETITQISHVTSGLNVKGLLRGITVLFFSESLVAQREALYIGLSILSFILIIVIGIWLISARTYITAFAMISAIMLPLLLLPPFAYATPSSPSYYVLASICHRIYLATTGFSIMVGTIIAFYLERFKKFGSFFYAASPTPTYTFLQHLNILTRIFAI